MLKKERETVKEIFNTLETMFPEAGCELVYQDIYQLTIAVILSAQTTDKAVNLVTPTLFEKYPTVADLSRADFETIKQLIERIGLANNKARNIIALAKIVVSDYQGVIPATFEELIKLPGIGRKTANVILSEGYGVPRLAVDTHVERVAKRLGLVDQDASVLTVEESLMEQIPENKWHQAHLTLLFFGRYFCKAQKPDCLNCFYKNECTDKKPQDLN